MTVALVVLSLFSNISFSMQLPTWERPLQKASLTEFDDAGNSINQDLRKELVLNSRLGDVARPTSFSLCEKLVSGDKCILFRVRVTTLEDQCGGLKFLAYEDTNFSSREEGKGRWLEVLLKRTPLTCSVDHWELRLSDPYGTRQHRMFSGVPTEVVTILGN